MSLMEWNEKLSVGVPSIDEQHKKLVAMLNELYDAMQAKHDQDALAKNSWRNSSTTRHPILDMRKNSLQKLAILPRQSTRKNMKN